MPSSSTTLYSSSRSAGQKQKIADMKLEWSSMNVFRETSFPSDLCPDNPTISKPRLAKDTMYAKAVLEAWKEDVDDNSETQSKVDVMGAPINYVRHSDETCLSGYFVINSNLLDADNNKNNNNHDKKSVPAILLFHTGAGPQDVFLRWKADMIARDTQTWGKDGCVVLIADIVSDSIGWTWTDREKYDTTRKELFDRSIRRNENENVAQRWKLRDTISAALEMLGSIDIVDTERIGAMGWCMGGHPILELGRMNIPGVHALVTFHGVFDGIEDDITSSNTNSSTKESNNNEKENEKDVLICNGAQDPFVSKDNLKIGQKTFEGHAWNTKILNYENVKHGFTNPAQDYNPSTAFAYNDDAAKSSWDAAMRLLKKQLL